MAVADQCWGCGSIQRPTNLSCEHLNTDGSYGMTRAWFHSEACYKETRRRYFSKESYADTKEGTKILTDILEEFQGADVPWIIHETTRGKAFKELDRFKNLQQADNNLLKHILMEQDPEDETEKEWQKMLADEERQKEKELREAERQQEKAERQAERERRELERQQDREERRLRDEHREQERRDEQERKRLEQEAEEERWQPRPFEP
jgi:hypothetical protein